MADVKRLNYFDKQFLRHTDFLVEQKYHIDHERDHVRLLHTPGIAEGLDVPDPPAGSTGVTINAGVAYDKAGHRIVLPNNVTQDLHDRPADQAVYLTIAFVEAETDQTNETGTTGNTRWTESPAIEVSATPPADADEKLVLARIVRTGTSVSSVDRTPRRTAGVKGGDLEVRSLTFTSPTISSTGWVTAELAAQKQADLGGTLHVTGDLVVDGTIKGDIAVGTVQAGDLQDSAVITAKIADGAVITTKMADNAVISAKITEADGTTGQNSNAGSGVKTGHIQDGAVTLQKLASTVQPIVSIDGVSNPGGNVDLVKAGAITIMPDDTNNLITIGETHSALTNNPHATTATQVGALATTGGILTGNVQVNANVGIGTSPAHRLHILGGDEPDNATYGTVSQVNTTGASATAVAFSGNASGTGASGAVWGLQLNTSGSGTAQKTGIYDFVSGEGVKTGAQIIAQTDVATSSASTTAISSNAFSSGTGPVTGVTTGASSDSTSQKTGIMVFATGADGLKIAAQLTASTSSTTSTATTYAMVVNASSAGTGIVYGLNAQVSGDNTGQKTGVYINTYGADGVKQAGQFYASTSSSTSSAQTNGVSVNASSAGTGFVQGLDVSVSGGSGYKRAAQFIASDATAGGSQAIYAQATNSGTGSAYSLQLYANASLATNNTTVFGITGSASTAGTGWVYGINLGVSASSASNASGVIGISVTSSTAGTGPTSGIQTSASTSGSQAYGISTSASSGGVGVGYALNASANANSTGPVYAVYATVGGSGTGVKYAGMFNGNVQVNGAFSVSGNISTTGTITAPVKPFLIDHPLDPYKKTLRHTAVESPEELCLYRGVVDLDANGKGAVKMPDYFAELTKEDDATVTLTAIGKKPFAASYEWNKKFTAFTVYGDAEGRVSYLVLANRDDPTIKLFRRPVEEEKSRTDRGKLLYPEAYGAGPEKSMLPVHPVPPEPPTAVAPPPPEAPEPPRAAIVDTHEIAAQQERMQRELDAHVKARQQTDDEFKRSEEARRRKETAARRK